MALYNKLKSLRDDHRIAFVLMKDGEKVNGNLDYVSPKGDEKPGFVIRGKGYLVADVSRVDCLDDPIRDRYVVKDGKLTLL